MDAKIRTKIIPFISKWILAFCVIMQPAFVFGENSYTSHKTTGISHIPWNMLLDPNYTSHNIPSSPNRTSFSPSHYNEYSPPVSYSMQQNSFSFAKDSANQDMYYIPSSTTQFPPYQSTKYSNQFVPQDHKPSHSFAAPVMSYRPSEKVIFPTSSSIQVSKSQVSHQYASDLQQKNTNAYQAIKNNRKMKQKKRKPDDYFDLDNEDYLDSYYQDYDYQENERPQYKPSKQSFYSNKYKGGIDPMGLLPSASDPEGYFSKAKDILRGGSQKRPTYSTSGSDYYPNYSTHKHYEDSTAYGPQSYYDQENIGYPSKENQYSAPGYDYDVPYSEGNYGGLFPYADKKKGSKYGPLAFALGLLPLGLLLASLVPTVVTIPVSTAVATGRRRKRSVRFVNPVLETISAYGVAALEDPTCLNRIFCQVVSDGKRERSSIVQKLYFKVANVLDEKVAAYVGLKQLLLAVRRDECHLFQCSANKKSVKMKKNNN